ncbi:hypothetical protein PMAYCL1PPCAC_19994 [Pristionchus mayeri]|uniref:G protein-coupled receptor n=1 Tax=Pristionchus mayeri TaxID=1317129 RepID=A0AAN5I2Z3_9BILA|nr:hypothetical protein PMAYCL1PPCAC_19994 [Pristionchus mayeri]
MISPPLATFFEPGPANSTRWIHTVVRLRYLAGLEPAYYAMVGAETVLLILSFGLIPVYTRHIWRRKPVHENLIFIALQQLVVYEVAIVARLVIILYESGLVEIEGVGFEPVATMNIIRLVHYVHVVVFCIVVFLERYLATRYVHNYEKQRRLHIPVVINTILMIASIGYGFRVVYAQSNAYFWTGVSLLPNSLAVFGFCVILERNELRLRRLNDHLSRQFYAEYTLSLRLQLKENIWSIRETRKGLLLLFSFFVPCALLIFLPAVLLRSPDTRTLLELFVAAGNLFMATGGPIIGIGMCVINERARALLLPSFILKSELEERRASIDEYFEILISMWEDAIGKSFEKKRMTAADCLY